MLLEAVYRNDRAISASNHLPCFGAAASAAACAAVAWNCSGVIDHPGEEDAMARLKAAVTHAAVVCAAIFAVTGASTFNAAAEDTVNVRFSWKMKGEYCQFYLAQEMGFFRDAGLN